MHLPFVNASSEVLIITLLLCRKTTKENLINLTVTLQVLNQTGFFLLHLEKGPLATPFTDPMHYGGLKWLMTHIQLTQVPPSIKPIYDIFQSLLNLTLFWSINVVKGYNRQDLFCMFYTTLVSRISVQARISVQGGILTKIK